VNRENGREAGGGERERLGVCVRESKRAREREKREMVSGREESARAHERESARERAGESERARERESDPSACTSARYSSK